MTNEEATEVFNAGQELLRALHGHLFTRGLEAFDRCLADLYSHAGLPHKLCDGCDADAPEQILKGGLCPRCCD
jgi:hypothetical protein